MKPAAPPPHLHTPTHPHLHLHLHRVECGEEATRPHKIGLPLMRRALRLLPRGCTLPVLTEGPAGARQREEGGRLTVRKYQEKTSASDAYR